MYEWFVFVWIRVKWQKVREWEHLGPSLKEIIKATTLIYLHCIALISQVRHLYYIFYFYRSTSTLVPFISLSLYILSIAILFLVFPHMLLDLPIICIYISCLGFYTLTMMWMHASILTPISSLYATLGYIVVSVEVSLGSSIYT